MWPLGPIASHTTPTARNVLYYSVADFGRIADAATRWKLYQESYFNALRGYILALETVTELRGVTYGMDIPEAYRTDVLRALLAQQETADVAAE